MLEKFERLRSCEPWYTIRNVQSLRQNTIYIYKCIWGQYHSLKGLIEFSYYLPSMTTFLERERE